MSKFRNVSRSKLGIKARSHLVQGFLTSRKIEAENIFVREGKS